uniref:outer membrane beta-barrel protein n=1 Tax=uncultured Proteiniphilum sp. TaxID=497637 RepID=UPI002636E072
AGSYKVTEMAVVEDLLKEMTGVEIDVDGTIKVNGKEIKKILVDGKEFFSNDPKIASKNLPAKMVDKLQVLDNKSEMEKMTGFDDEVEEMVINLTVKPDMRQGVFGNAFAGYGNKERYEANAMVNYMRNRDQMTFIGGINNTNNAGFSDLAPAMLGGTGGDQGSRGGRGGGGGGSNGITTSGNTGFNFNKEFSKKLEIGGNARYGRSHTESASKIYTQNFLSKGDTYETENDRSNSFSDNVNFDLRIEWKPDSLTSLVFRPNASFYKNEREEESDFATTRENSDTVNFGNSGYASHGNGNNFGGNIHLNRRLGKQGRSISLGLDAGTSDSESRATNLSNTYYNGTRPDDLIDQRITNKNSGTNWRSSLSYVEPIGEQKFLQFSYSYRQNSSGSDRDTRTQDEEGNYTIYDKQYSKILKNSSIDQDISLTFRSRREKYNYSVGFNIYPSTSKRKTFVGDSLINDLTQKVTNYSPNAQFNYMWTRQKNLRFTYNGSTDQPSVNQISPVTDITNPLNITYGNPDLKPSFHHRLDLRYQNSQPENNRFYMLNSNFNYTTNAIVTSRFTDQETGKKENTYMNVNGNWDASMRFTTTQPIISKRFTVSSTTSTSYSRSHGFSNYEENISKQTNLSENLSFNYKSNRFNFSVRGNISYNKVKNSLEGQQDREFFNYGTSANTTIYLPFDLNIQSDIRYSTNSGYADGFKQNEILWNASLEKQILKQKNGIVRLKVYDILQQRSNIRRNVSSNFIRDTTTNTLTNYFIVHFVYRFNVFKGGASRSDMQRRGPRGEGSGRS